MDDEMRYHIECETADRIRQGMTPDDARRSAIRDFGGVERHKEDARDARGFRPLDDGARDAAYALRVLRKNPGFTTAVVLTFALGIGCSCAIFSLVHGILVRPLPYTRPNELVALWERNVARGADRNVVSEQNFAAWRKRSRAFSAMAAMTPIPLTLDGSPVERISGAQVSPSYFRMLGAHPALGRDFTDADEVNGGTDIVILSDALWRNRFGADPSVVGRPISMDGRSFTVIGVMPPSFEPPGFGWMTEHPLWLPFGANDGKHAWGRFLHVIARRQPGVSLEQARADLAAVSDQLSREIEADKGWSTNVVPLAQQIVGDVRKPLVVIFAAVLLLLLMSVVNVANLMVTFTRRRQHELAVRRAIGATWSRLLRQQLALSGTLGVFGTIVGLAVAVVATRLLVVLMPSDVPRLQGVHVDGSVLAFASAIACVSTLIFGSVAAIRGFARSADALDLSAASRTTPRLAGAKLVAAEVAIGLALSVSAALMIRSLINLRAVDLGFQTESTVAGRVSLPTAKYESVDQQRAFFDALLSRVRATPGVASASIATTRPFACCAPATVVSDALRSGESVATAPTTDVRYVDGAYFSTLRIGVAAGSVFGSREAAAGPPRAVVSRSLARALWGGENAVGRRISIKLFGTTVAEVIGVVDDVHLADARTSPRPAVFLSTDRYPSSERDIIVRGSGDVGGLLGAVRQSLASIDATIPLYRATSLDRAVAITMAQDRITTMLLAAFAVLALLLAAVGVYGVLSGDVNRRRKEIGIRLALGATGGTVTGMVLRRGLTPAVIGVGIGIGLALLLARSMSALVFGIGAYDAETFLVVTAALLVVAMSASIVPALRATRVSPLEAIRTD
jgi:predicted permease